MRKIIRKQFIIAFVLIVFGSFLGLKKIEAACGDAGTNNVYGWGWNNYIGWISLNCDQDVGTGISSTHDYGVNISGADVSGHAWSGWGDGSTGNGYWMCFGSSCISADYASFPGSGSPSSAYGSDNVNGWAKFLGWGDDGWVKLSETTPITYSMNVDRHSASSFFYVVKAFLTSPVLSTSGVGGYSWNNKIGWIRWYSVCADVDADGYGVAVAGWGISDDAICGNDCEDSAYAINPGNDEAGDDECADGLDNDCDGFIDCDDSGCPTSVTGPATRELVDNKCGEISVAWSPYAGSVVGTCEATSSSISADSYSVYRSLASDGCTCTEGESGGCTGSAGSACVLIGADIDPASIEINVGDTGYTEYCGSASTDPCFVYIDYSVIPRVEYHYWVTRTAAVDIIDPDDGSTIDTDYIESPVAAFSDPGMTICYPGAEWKEE